jgi:hypothetical protein
MGRRWLRRPLLPAQEGPRPGGLAPTNRVSFGSENGDLDHVRRGEVQDVTQLAFARIIKAKRRVMHQCHVAGRSYTLAEHGTWGEASTTNG